MPLLAAAVWARAAETIPTELFPPDTRIVASISLRSLLDSPLLKGMLGDNPKVAGFALPVAGIDPLRDFDTVLLATSGQGKNAPGLAVLRGRFAAAETKGATIYHGVPLFPNPKDARAAFAVLDSETAIVGPTAELQAAIDRRGRASVLEASLASRLAELDGHYDLWSVGRIPVGLSAPNPAMKSLESIDRFEFGAALQDGLRLHGEVHVRTARDAAQLEASFQMLGAMLNANPPSGGTRLDLRAEGGRLEVNLFVPEAELRKTMAAQKVSLAGLLQGGIGARMGEIRPAGPAMVAPPAPVQIPASRAPGSPAKIVTNERGETVSVTLPPGLN